MAKLRIDGSDLVVELSALEQVGSFVGGVRVPLSTVKSLRITNAPYRDGLRGMRVGTGVPFVVVLGRMVHRSGTDFVAVYGTGRTAVIDLEGAPWKRIMVSSPDDAVIEKLLRHLDTDLGLAS